eukprot:3632861-Rhodomonas_salina.1
MGMVTSGKSSKEIRKQDEAQSSQDKGNILTFAFLMSFVLTRACLTGKNDANSVCYIDRAGASPLQICYEIVTSRDPDSSRTSLLSNLLLHCDENVLRCFDPDINFDSYSRVFRGLPDWSAIVRRLESAMAIDLTVEAENIAMRLDQAIILPCS